VVVTDGCRCPLATSRLSLRLTDDTLPLRPTGLSTLHADWSPRTPETPPPPRRQSRDPGTSWSRVVAAILQLTGRFFKMLLGVVVVAVVVVVLVVVVVGERPTALLAVVMS